MHKTQWVPYTPFGAIIPDSCMAVRKTSFPRLVYIPLDICRKIDTDPVCPTYWNKDIELPPLPLELIWALINQTELPAPGHAMQFKAAIAEANHGIAVLRKPTHWHGPGYFEVHPWTGTAEEARSILED